MPKRASSDPVVEELKDIIRDIGVPPKKRQTALGILRIFTAKKISQGQVNGARTAQQALRKEDHK